MIPNTRRDYVRAVIILAAAVVWFWLSCSLNPGLGLASAAP